MAAAAERQYAMEPATGRWCHPPEILFTEYAPLCDRCGERTRWLAPTKAARYRLSCSCGDDALEEWPGLRFCIGGTLSWWHGGRMSMVRHGEVTRARQRRTLTDELEEESFDTITSSGPYFEPPDGPPAAEEG